MLFRLGDGSYAVVHLGYPHTATPHPDWVRKYLFDTFDTFDGAIAYVEAHEPDYDP